MGKLLQKLFGGIHMTWPKVVIFASCAGVYTALMALFVPARVSFHDIAVTFEAWILLAIIVMVNCEKPLESACKTFVFFLISQPLVYLIQVPFSEQGWGLFGYYRYWFVWTLLTFPMAFVGWFLKKNRFYSAIILSPMLVYLVWQGLAYVWGLRYDFPDHLLSAIFCFGIIPVLVFGLFTRKEPILISLAVSILALGALLFLTRNQVTDSFVSGNVILAEEEYDMDSSWSADVDDHDFATAEIDVNENTGYTRVIVHYQKAGSGILVLTDGKGNTHRIQISCDEERHVDEKLID